MAGVTKRLSASSKQPAIFIKASILTLENLNKKPVGEDACQASAAIDIFYLDQRAGCGQVLLKLSKVILGNGCQTVETYAILDHGSERTILLQAAAKQLGLENSPARHSGPPWFDCICSPSLLPASCTADLRLHSLPMNCVLQNTLDPWRPANADTSILTADHPN